MRYTWRIGFAVLFAMTFILSYLWVGPPSKATFFLMPFNLFLVYIIGLQLDKYFHSKKQLHSTKGVLTDYSYALDSAIDAIGITNEDGNYEFANEALAKLYGYEKDEWVNINWKDHYSTDSLTLLDHSLLPDLAVNGYSRGEVIGVKKDGSTFPQEISLSHIKETQKIIWVIRDITQKKLDEELIKNKAELNDLTELPNRHRLQKELEVALMSSTEVSILYMDLDRFKIANDTLGHEIGDKLLKDVALRLNVFENEHITAYHLAGDEFIILIQSSDPEFVQNVAKDIIDYIKEPFFINENEVFVTASIGISSFPQHTNDMNNLIKMADTAMYYAKMEGKNTFKVYNTDLNLQLERKTMIEMELRKAIRNDELSIHYQPKFDLQTNELAGIEALIRWNNPALGMVSPMEFIPIAEETGLIIDIGNWVISEALYQMRKWQDKGHTLVKVSVNVSPRQFRDVNLIPFISSSLYSFNIDANYLELEVTESVFENVELVLPKIQSLKELGVGLSIDDFGTGYSSLSLLKNLPFDTLKIDQSFVRDLIGNDKDIALIKTIIAIGKTFNLNVVAEGIETEEHLNLLAQMDCPMGQGYYFSKPIPSELVEKQFFARHANHAS